MDPNFLQRVMQAGDCSTMVCVFLRSWDKLPSQIQIAFEVSIFQCLLIICSPLCISYFRLCISSIFHIDAERSRYDNDGIIEFKLFVISLKCIMGNSSNLSGHKISCIYLVEYICNERDIREY